MSAHNFKPEIDPEKVRCTRQSTLYEEQGFLRTTGERHERHELDPRCIIK